MVSEEKMKCFTLANKSLLALQAHVNTVEGIVGLCSVSERTLGKSANNSEGAGRGAAGLRCAGIAQEELSE